MRCEQTRDRIGALVDGELAAGEREAVIQHASECAECGNYRNELVRMRDHLQQAREIAPPKLLDRVSAHLSIAASEMDSGIDEAPAGRGFRRALAGFVPWAAVVLLACAISIAGTLWWAHRADGQETLSRDVLAAHVRSLLQDNAVQIASRDTHTVKPWFAGRLEFSPVVKGPVDGGFPTGRRTARLCRPPACCHARLRASAAPDQRVHLAVRRPFGTGGLFRQRSMATICWAGARRA